MGSRYLLELEACARATGAPVHLEAGWQTRGRSSGGFDPGRPTHIMCHHTASGASSDGQSDVDYMTYRADAAPIANLYLSRAGEIWVMAAGACNTNGAGHDWWGGGVPDDSMNTHAVGIEAANAGTGEAWPAVQQEVYALLVRELRAALSIPVAHVRDHQEYSGARKCDITGPARWGGGNANGCSGAPKWSMDGFRADQAAGWPNGGPIDLPGEDEPVDYLELMGNSTQYSLFARSGVFAVNITNAERDADRRTRDPAPRTVRTSDAAVLKSLVLVGDEPVWYDGTKWPPAAAFGGYLPRGEP